MSEPSEVRSINLGVVAASIIAIAVSLVTLVWWQGLQPAVALEVSVPGMDDPDGRKAADAQRRKNQDFNYGELYQRFAGVVTPTVSDPPLSEAAKALKKKLKSIVVTKVSFEDTPVTTVFDFLKTRSRELDPEGVGVNFYLTLKSDVVDPLDVEDDDDDDDGDVWGEDDDGDDDDDVWGEDDDDDDDDDPDFDDDDDDGPEDDGPDEPTITMDFDNIPLDELIRYICEGTGLKSRIDGHAVLIHGPGVAPIPPLAPLSPEASGAAISTRKKMESIVLTKMSFEDTPVTTVFDFLKTRMRELDPEGTGVSLSIAGAAPIHAKDEPTITMDFDDIPLLHAIHYICWTSKLDYEIRDEGGVRISGSDGSHTDGSWPWFRGPDRSSTNKQSIKLADSFPPEGPKKLWEIELGAGYAGAAVRDGKVYIMDHIEGTGDVLRCFSFEEGKELWRTGYKIRVANNHGITRTVPTVTDKYIVTMGPMGQVMCVDRKMKKALWGMSLSKKYGTRDLSSCWYAGQCPYVDGDTAIIAPAGKEVMMIAVSCETGEVLWEAPNKYGWKMSHSSITKMTVGGTPMYIYAAIGGITAVGAEGSLAGKVLWDTDKWTSSVLMPSPVVLKGDRVFFTSGYGGGSALVKVVKEGGKFRPEFVYNFNGRKKFRDCFSTYQHTPIYHKDHLFGIQLNSARKHKMEFVCVDPNETGGRIVWGSGKDTDFTAPKKREAWGPYILADGKFYVIGDTGLLAMFKASTKSCQKLGEWKLMEHGHEVWGPLAIVDGRLFVREYSKLLVFDIR